MPILVKLEPGAIKPVKAHDGDAGFDLFANEEVIIPFGERRLISTGVSIQIPKGYFGEVAPRSGLSCKGLDRGAGIIDASYRGIIKVLLINNNNKTKDVVIEFGDKIAQLIIHRISDIDVLLEVDELPDTERGSGGFGSTGNK